MPRFRGVVVAFVAAWLVPFRSLDELPYHAVVTGNTAMDSKLSGSKG